MEESKAASAGCGAGGHAPNGSTGEAAGGGGAPADAPRLIIQSLILENFKSYGEEKVVGPFHTSLSAVVGPNGSGKSNVIDALLFVFGKRAKQLRLHKVSELIHKSSTMPDLEYAKVTVKFADCVDHADGSSEVIPGSHFELSRVAFRNNTSKYLLNGKSSNFTEVTTLLRRRGVDLDNNRFLILQGEVEQIAMMPPKGRNPHEDGHLEYLEDIIGTNKYVEQIEAQEKKVEEISERRIEGYKRCKAAETEKNNLESAKTETETYLIAERAALSGKYTLQQVALLEEEEAMESCASKIEEMQGTIKAANEETAEKMKELKTAARAVKKAAAAAKQAEEVDRKAQEAFSELEHSIVEADGNLKDVERQLKKQEIAMKNAVKRKSTAEKKKVELEESIPELQDAVAACEAAKEAADAEVEKNLEVVMSETQSVREAVEAKQAELAPLSARTCEAQSQVDTLTTEIQLLEEQMGALEKERAGLSSTQTEIAAQLKKAAATLKNAKKESKETNAAKAKAERELEAAVAEEAELAKVVEELRLETWEQRQAFEAANTGTSRLAEQLMGATERGQPLEGVGLHGRLGDLGAIDMKYDVAITTACSALNSFVVDSSADATACISYLKTIGARARFILLDQMQAVPKSMPPIPGGTQRLYDLVKKSHERFEPAFYFALGNTLVAADLDSATAAAFREGSSRAHHRVVTTAGDLIDKSGTMSGGGKPRKGGMGRSKPGTGRASRESVDRAEESLKDAQARHKECRSRIETLRKELRELSKKVAQLANAVAKSEQEIAHCEERAQGVAEQLEGLAGKSGPSEEDATRLKELKSQLKAAEKELTTASKASSALEEEIASLQAKVKDAGGSKVQKARAKAKTMLEALTEANRAVKKAQTEHQKAIKDISKAEKEVAKLEKDIQDKKDSLEGIQKQRADTEVLMEGRKEAMLAAEEAKRKADNELEDVTNEHDELEKAVGTLKEKAQELKSSIDEVQATIRRHKQQAKALRQACEDLKHEFNATLLADAPKAGDVFEIGPGTQSLKEDDGEAASEGVEESKSSGGVGDEPELAEDGEDAEAGADAEEDASYAAVKRSLPSYTPEQLKDLDLEKVESEISIAEAKAESMRGSLNMNAIHEYRKKDAEYRKRVAELERVSAERDEARRVYDQLRKRRLDEFMAGFSIITMKLKEMYQMITMGGDAELELVDSLDPFSEGIVFSVRPPKKSWKNISNLSGGEKTLSSLALVFALHHYKPTPLYVMDEIDAALDFKNVSIVANYIKERTKNAQFIIISLRNNMFELADRLVGIYKTQDITKSVAINPKEIAAAGGMAPAKPSVPAGQPATATPPEPVATAAPAAPVGWSRAKEATAPRASKRARTGRRSTTRSGGEDEPDSADGSEGVDVEDATPLGDATNVSRG